MSDSNTRRRIYLAGPDIFFPQSEQIYAQLQAHCARLNMVGVPPSDGGLAAGFKGDEDALARRIFEGNIALIRSADGVLANLMCFRGHEPDSGTVFEVGYARALGKPVVGYGVPGTSYASRVSAAIPCLQDSAGVMRETASGVMVEGLGQRINLMLACSTRLEPSVEAAVARMAELLRATAASVRPPRQP